MNVEYKRIFLKLLLKDTFSYLMNKVSETIPLYTPIVPYANSLDLGETPSNSSKPFDTQATFSTTLCEIEAHSKLKQTRNLADDNCFSG